MNRAWKDRTSKEPEYAQKRAYAKEAYLTGCWIYSVDNDIWYTPEEFMASGERIRIYRGQEEKGKYLIRDPKAGLKEKLEQLKKLQLEVDEYSRKLMNYFDFNISKTKKP